MKFFKTRCALLLLLPLMVFENVFAQPNQTPAFSISSSSTNFSVSSVAALTTALSITSSFALNVTSQGNPYDLKASITSKSFNPASTVFSSIPLSITLNNIANVNTTGQQTGPLPLVENPAYVSLATGATKTNKKEAVWTYDLALSPVGFSIAPGNYVFTVSVVYNDGTYTLSQSFNITLNVTSVVDLSLVQNTSTTVNFASSSAYVNGLTFNNFHSMLVNSNVPWLISVAAQTPYFSSGSAGASNNMPCSVMKIRPSGSSGFLPLSTTATTIKTGNRGDLSVPANSPSFDVNFDPGYNYSPGVYNLSLTYTLTSQ